MVYHRSTNGTAILLAGHHSLKALVDAKRSGSLPVTLGGASVIHRMHSVELGHHPAAQQVLAPPPHGAGLGARHNDPDLFPGTQLLGPHGMQACSGPFTKKYPHSKVKGWIPSHGLVRPFRDRWAHRLRKSFFNLFTRRTASAERRFLWKPVRHSCENGTIDVGIVRKCLDDMQRVFDTDDCMSSPSDIALYTVEKGMSDCVTNVVNVESIGGMLGIHLGSWGTIDDLVPGEEYEFYPEALNLGVVRCRMMHQIARMRIIDSNDRVRRTLSVAVLICSLPTRFLRGACGTPIFLRRGDTGQILGVVRFMMQPGTGDSSEIFITTIPDEIRNRLLI